MTDLASARRAEAADLEAIVALAELSVAELRSERGGELLLFHDLTDVGAKERYQRALADDQRCLAVGMVDDIVVGFAYATIIVSSGRRACMIDELVVHPDARGVGVGARVLAHVTDWALASKCTTIESHVLPGNRAAKNFFERVGMVTRKMQVSTNL